MKGYHFIQGMGIIYAQTPLCSLSKLIGVARCRETKRLSDDEIKCRQNFFEKTSVCVE
jgi:hypothetical protein